MGKGPGGSRLSLLAIVLLMGLLVVLATLQYRWLGQVAEAERTRARANLAAAASGFATDFDREVGRIFACFVPATSSELPLGARVARRSECVANAGLQPLIADVFVAQYSDSGEPALSRLDLATRRLTPVSWSPPLEKIRRRLEARVDGGPGGGFDGRRRFAESIDGELPGFIRPEVPGGFAGLRESSGGRTDFVVVRLDSQYLRTVVFPGLARRHFRGDLADYDVWVIRDDDPSHPLYSSGPNTTGFSTPDATADVLTFRVFEEARRMEAGARPPSPNRSPDLPGSGRPGPPPPVWRPRGTPRGDPFPPGPWSLAVFHRGGSLNAAVARARHRNLAVGFGILAVLAGSATLLMVSARRAHRLARQQIAFVAAITHELNTPLAAIRSAGQNLADGVVAETDQVRRYGSLIESEGRRLSEMVTRVLDFAGIRSGLRSYRLRPASVESIVDGALAHCRLAAEERGVRIDRDVPAGLPPILADEEALGRAVQNLVDNAIKYGGAGQWVRVRALVAGNGGRPEVEIAVEDRGAGVRPSERRRIFEPFYRGEGSSANGVAGSGLGLALVRPIVEAHGGTVTVESKDGEPGARFRIRIPAAPDAGDPEAPPA